MNVSTRNHSRKRRRRWLCLGLAAALILPSCADSAGSPHDGRFPFRLMERPPGTKAERGTGMYEITRWSPGSGKSRRRAVALIRPGDVVCFHMSHRETWQWLRAAKIQKVPYEIFRYGHLALVVPDPASASREAPRKLLQVAMRQPVDATSGMEYLDDKSWIVFRPAEAKPDVARLHEFARIATARASSPKKAYDYTAAFGIHNGAFGARREEDIAAEYTCTTLVTAGLDYAGCPLRAVRRGGWFDVVTPRQVVESPPLDLNHGFHGREGSR